MRLEAARTTVVLARRADRPSRGRARRAARAGRRRRPGRRGDASASPRWRPSGRALEQDQRAALERELAELEQRRTAAAAEAERLRGDVEAARAELTRAEEQAEAARARRREAERAVEAARREAARVGGELAAANQFLRAHAGAPGGAPALADALDVDGGYELALAAALDGRLRAAVVADRAAGAELLERAGRDGGSALVAGTRRRSGCRIRSRRPPGAERLLDHVRGPADTLALATALLSDTWVVDDVADVREDFHGIAVTQSGRVWIGAWRELRQVPAGGEERVLAERNRRDRLDRRERDRRARRAPGRAARRGARRRRRGRRRRPRRGRDLACARPSAPTTRRPSRSAASLRLIEQRRSADDEGPGAVRRAQIEAELTAERRLAERAERERAERTAASRRPSRGSSAPARSSPPPSGS